MIGELEDAVVASTGICLERVKREREKKGNKKRGGGSQ